MRPSSLARYIAWSAATSTASAPASRLAAEHRDPDADRRRAQLGDGREALGDLGPQVLAELQGAVGVGLRHQHRELVAGEAGDDVGGAHPLAQDRRRSRRIRLSPGWWPSRSLTSLRPSMSMIITAPWPP